MNKKTLLALCLFAGLTACGDRSAETPVAETAAPETSPPALPARTVSPADATVFFVSPADGDTVSNPISVVFGIEGMDVVPAGDDAPHSGHHHLLIDTGLPDMAFPIPKDANHVHFGDGSTATEITLEPGEHTLQMLLGDYLHIPHDEPLMSEVITIKVE